ncbi:GUN4 domain-containing protein [Brasilonema sp. UFV-L1]
MQRFLQILIKWLPVGAGGFYAISLLISSQWILAATIAVGTLWLAVINLRRDKGRRLEQFQVPPQYEKLASYLAAGEWKKADEETTKLLMEEEQGSLFNAVWTNLPRSVTSNEMFIIPTGRILKYCQSIPCEKILMVDQLWVRFSRGWFGLSVHRRVLLESDGYMNSMADRLGWRENNQWISHEDITFDIKAPMGHLPVDYLFAVDRASSYIAPEWQRCISYFFINKYGEGEAHVIWTPVVWQVLISRLEVCVKGETSEALNHQQLANSYLINELWSDVMAKENHNVALVFDSTDDTNVSIGGETSETPREQQLETSVNQLETYLINGQWRNADQETLHIIIQMVGREDWELFDTEWLEDFPCEYLHILDQLWVKYSNGKFGLSVQKQIWEECGNYWGRFEDRVGWLVTGV